ncbi:MAG: adenylate/guanylate cyclase domain-containing protein [Chloroflexi bacterium]|nr:adenylate/guanylate cyclase domain-containing protein [Chloroflexota bacterium]
MGAKPRLLEKISLRVHALARNRRVQARLELGSAIALAAGLFIVILLAGGVLKPLETFFTDLFFTPTATLTRVEQAPLIQVVMIFLVALLAGATLPHLQLLSATGLALLYLLFYLTYAFQQFDAGILVQPIYPLLALALTFFGVMLYRYWAEDRPRAVMDRMFSGNTAPDALDQVIRIYDHGTLSLAGTRRVVTAMSIDLRDFDALVETSEPRALIDHANNFIKMIAAIVFRHKGIVIQQSGNALIALWNLPLDQINHARAALNAAQEIRTETRARVRAHNLDVQVGIGIATGAVVAGRIGNSTRATYSVIGDVITLAERLAAKRARGIYLDARTQEQVGSNVDTRESSPIRLRGRPETYSAWRVIEAVEEEKMIEEDEFP